MDTTQELIKLQGTEVLQEGSSKLEEDDRSKYHMLFIPVGATKGKIQVLIDSQAKGEFISEDCGKMLRGKTFQNQKLNIELFEGSHLIKLKESK